MTAQELAAEMHKFGIITFNRWAIDGAAMLLQQAEQIEALTKMLVISDDTHQTWMKANAPSGWIDDLRIERDALIALSEQLTRERDALKQQAQIHAMEAKTANSTIYEIYQVVSGGTGEPGNWNGAKPVRKAFDLLKADAERYRKIKPSFVWDNENSHGHWACYIPSTMWGPDGEPDAAIDAMKGAT